MSIDWRDTLARAIATTYQAFAAVLLAGGVSDEIADVALWQRAALAGLAGLLTFGQRLAQDVLDRSESGHTHLQAVLEVVMVVVLVLLAVRIIGAT